MNNTTNTFNEPLLAELEASELRSSPEPSLPSASGARVVAGSAPPSLRRLFESNKYHRLTIEHVNVVDKLALYLRSDLYHTLINMRWYFFLIIFLTSYFIMYCTFAFAYWNAPRHCVSNINKFLHALWFSVHTAATIGYGHQAPNPNCTALNFITMLQVLTGALMQAALLGLVFARFSAPGSRAATIKFSSILACYRGPDGFRRLAFRVANVRRHQVLQPEVRMVLMQNEHVGGPQGPQEYRYHELKLTHVSGGSRLWLGVPSIVAHTIDHESPLWGLTRRQLESNEEELEFVVLLDGIDETTSTVMQARHSYTPGDIRWGQEFAGVIARRPATGTLAADYSHFDLTRLAEEDEAMANDHDSLVENITSLSGRLMPPLPGGTTAPMETTPTMPRGGGGLRRTSRQRDEELGGSAPSDEVLLDSAPLNSALLQAAATRNGPHVHFASP